MSEPESTNEPKQHRFRFAAKWERRRERRSLKRAWMVIALDLALLAVVVSLTWFLVKQLS